jgi:hypothetical protein
MGIRAVHSTTHKFTRHPNEAIGQITFIPFGKGLPVFTNREPSPKKQTQSEYGLQDLCIGVPVEVGGANGIESIVEIQLSEAEKTKLTASAAAAEKTNGLLIHEPPVSTKCKKPLFWVFYAFNSKLLKILPMNFVMFFLTLLKIHVYLSI